MVKAPDAFRTISEVADQLDTPAHVLRFWESKFAQVKPVKRAGGRRYYRPDDVALLGGIKALLHDQGMTIKGAQKMMRERGIKVVMALGQPEGFDSDDVIDAITAAPPQDRITEARALRSDAPEVEDDTRDNVVPLALDDSQDDIDDTPEEPTAPQAPAPVALPPDPAPRGSVPSRVLADLARMDRDLSAARRAALAPVLARLDRVHAAMTTR